MSVIFVPDPKGWYDAFQSPSGMTGQFIGGLGRNLASLARAQVGKRDYTLVRSIGYNVSAVNGEVEVEVGSGVRHARLHHDGTTAHMIRAKNASKLRFSQRGRVVYATAVMHPGTKPNRYLTDNLSKVIPM